MGGIGFGSAPPAVPPQQVFGTDFQMYPYMPVMDYGNPPPPVLQFAFPLFDGGADAPPTLPPGLDES